MTSAPAAPRYAFLLALVLLAPTFAGCIGAAGDEEYATLADAREQAHTELAPEEDSSYRLGLIEPTTTQEIPKGETNVTVVLWNTDTEQPVTDADVTVDAFMPMMGHGTEPETDPTHVRSGVYRGSTNLMMGGDWLVYLNATLASGDQLTFELDVNVAGDDMEDDMDHGPTTSYGSYEEAKQAEGETFAPEENATTRLKLLEPVDRHNATQGQQNVTVLFYDEATDEPVTNGTASLNATMSAMGHGTSPEQDPVHAAHGVWKGMTTFTMNGTWILTIALEDDERNLTWSIDATVGEGSMDHGEMDEPAFEPYEEVFEDTIDTTDYDVNHTLPVEAAGATLTMNGSLSGASPLAEVTVELYDANGTRLGSFTLSSETNESQLTVEDAPNGGDYTVRVQGMALDASYRVAVHVAPP